MIVFPAILYDILSDNPYQRFLIFKILKRGVSVIRQKLFYNTGMSAEIIIRQTGLFKKELPLSVILGEKLAYGHFDGWRLQENVIKSREFVIYDPDRIGRGIGVSWQKGEKNEITLRLLMICSESELRTFFDCVQRITSFWNCRMYVDGQEMRPEELESLFDEWLALQIHSLQDAAGRILDGDGATLTMYCAMWPLSLGMEEAEMFSTGNGLLKFEDWLHEKQKIDAFYARISFYKGEEGILGVIVLSEGVRVILPSVPHVPPGMEDVRTGKPLVCDNYRLYLFSGSEDREIGSADYAKGIEAIPAEKKTRYDGNHILVEPMTKEELEQIAGLRSEE